MQPLALVTDVDLGAEELTEPVFSEQFLAWAVADRISLKRRPPQALRTLPPGRWNDVLAVVVGLALYAVTIAWGHRWLIGVAPLG